MFKALYAAFAYLGLMVLPASFIMGFRYEAGAPLSNLWFNLALYAGFIAVHIVMTMPAFKGAVFGSREGTPAERRIYVAISVITWVGLYALHRPIGGYALDAAGPLAAYLANPWVGYLGLCCVLLGVVAFFEFATFESLSALVAMPGAAISHTAGAETPLLTEGPYAKVRHPMYRAAALYTLASLLIHPNTAQLCFVLLISASFIGFVPFEERQLLQHRGREYRAYIKVTRYRVIPRVW